MAKRGRGAGGGPMKGIITGVWLLVVAGGLLGWAQANDIRTVDQAWDYARGWADETNRKVDECVTEKGIVCNPDGTGGTGSNPGGGTENEGGTGTGGGTETNDKEFKGLTAKLNAIPTQEVASVDYDRDEWRHWSDLDGNGCDAREDVLNAQGTSVVLEVGDACRPESGKWVSPYEGKVITDPSSIDIDHVIPLGYAATHGGQDWSAEKKEQFANDFDHLLATSASTNRSKSDKGPGEYMPEKVTYWCTYSKLWINTTSEYGLWLEATDKAKLNEGLGTC